MIILVHQLKIVLLYLFNLISRTAGKIQKSTLRQIKEEFKLPPNDPRRSTTQTL